MSERKRPGRAGDEAAIKEEPSRRSSGRARRDASHERATETVEQALARAADHGRRAASEALLAARALLDALSLALHGAGADERRILGLAARSLDELAEGLAGGPSRAGLLDAVSAALDAEIARWEARARNDVDARAILRAYLGLREILWEFGVRRASPRKRDEAPPEAAGATRPGRPAPEKAPSSPRPRRSPPGGRSGRMKRVPVEN